MRGFFKVLRRWLTYGTTTSDVVTTVFAPTDYIVEPTNQQSLYYITSLQIANAPRFPSSGLGYLGNMGILSGDPIISSATVSFDLTESTLSSDGSLNLEIAPTTKGIRKPSVIDGSEMYKSGTCGDTVSCSNLIQSINGLTISGDMPFSVEGGLELDTTTTPHTIIIKKSTSPNNDGACNLADCVQS